MKSEQYCTEINWPDLMLPPINLYNVPSLELDGLLDEDDIELIEETLEIT